MEYEIKYNVLEYTFDQLIRLNILEEDRRLLGAGTMIKLETVDGKGAEELMGEQFLRDYVQDILDCEKRGDFKIATAVELTLKRTLKEYARTSAPLRPPTDYELIAYVDGLQGGLICDTKVDGQDFTLGHDYAVRTQFFKYEEAFTIDRPHYDEIRKKYVQKKHRIVRRGQDRSIIIDDDDGVPNYFAEKPSLIPDRETDSKAHNLDMLWVLFERPVLPTVKEMMPTEYDYAMQCMNSYETLANFDYYAGQRDFIARMACRKTGILGAACGCGKSLMAITLMKIKIPRGKILLMAPASTVQSGNAYTPAQWVEEFTQFAPEIKVFELFSEEDYSNIKDRYRGKLPDGVYITYPEAFFMKGKAREFIPPTWLDSGKRKGWGKTSQAIKANEWDVEAKFRDEIGLPELDLDNLLTETLFHKGVGEQDPVSGICCIATASLASIVASEQGDFDGIFLDEAHMVCSNIKSQRGARFLRLRAEYRYCLSATPIPNNIGDMFGILGWVSVEDWNLGRNKSAQWPYTVDEKGRFESQYLSYETDLTATVKKAIKYGKGGKQVKVKNKTSRSQVISQPTSLLKLLKPVVGYVAKNHCRIDVPAITEQSVRVPMGTVQAQTYESVRKGSKHNPFVSMSNLRQIVSAPGAYATPEWTPKVTTTLQLILQCLEKNDQVVVVSARHDMTNMLGACLYECDVPYSRLDGTLSGKMQSWNSTEFKSQRSAVMLMGIKCAVGHSYPKCPNLIATSLEWSYGTKEQAFGRVHRVNSERPVNVWCVLTTNSIEETIFDRVGQKEDSAVLCLHGQRVSRTPKFSSPEDILAEHMIDYSASETIDEKICEAEWPNLKQRLTSVSTTWDPTQPIQ